MSGPLRIRIARAGEHRPGLVSVTGARSYAPGVAPSLQKDHPHLACGFRRLPCAFAKSGAPSASLHAAVLLLCDTRSSARARKHTLALGRTSGTHAHAPALSRKEHVHGECKTVRAKNRACERWVIGSRNTRPLVFVRAETAHAHATRGVSRHSCGLCCSHPFLPYPWRVCVHRAAKRRAWAQEEGASLWL